MRVSVDRVGRIVIPKPLRDALGIGPDTQLEVSSDGGGIRLEPVHTTDRVVTLGPDGLPVLLKVEGVRITEADVRKVRDDVYQR